MRSPLALTAALIALCALPWAVSRTLRDDDSRQLNPRGTHAAQPPHPGKSTRAPAIERTLPPIVIDPASLGVPREIPPADHPARIRDAIAVGDDAALTRATVAWFEADPAAVRDWLVSQPTLEALQPALAGIAVQLAEHGHTGNAIEWAATLDHDEDRNEALFTIHALGLRNGSISPEDLNDLDLPGEMIDELAGGAAGD